MGVRKEPSEKKVKINLSISPEQLEYLQERCKANGVAMSTYIQMMIINERRQTEAMNKMGDLPKMLDDLKKLAETQQTTTLLP